jgi:hypothetical protein
MPRTRTLLPLALSIESSGTQVFRPQHRRAIVRSAATRVAIGKVCNRKGRRSGLTETVGGGIVVGGFERRKVRFVRASAASPTIASLQVTSKAAY